MKKNTSSQYKVGLRRLHIVQHPESEITESHTNKHTIGALRARKSLLESPVRGVRGAEKLCLPGMSSFHTLFLSLFLEILGSNSSPHLHTKLWSSNSSAPGNHAGFVTTQIAGLCPSETAQCLSGGRICISNKFSANIHAAGSWVRTLRTTALRISAHSWHYDLLHE